jgi:hypothetical protein
MQQSNLINLREVAEILGIAYQTARHWLDIHCPDEGKVWRGGAIQEAK